MPNVLPLWDHPASEHRKLSTWKLQMDTLVSWPMTINWRTLKKQHLVRSPGRRSCAPVRASPSHGSKEHDGSRRLLQVHRECLQIPQSVAFHRRLRTCRQVDGRVSRSPAQPTGGHATTTCSTPTWTLPTAWQPTATTWRPRSACSRRLRRWATSMQAVEYADASARVVCHDAAVRSVAQSRPGVAPQQRQRDRSPGRGQPERRFLAGAPSWGVTSWRGGFRSHQPAPQSDSPASLAAAHAARKFRSTLPSEGRAGPAPRLSDEGRPNRRANRPETAATESSPRWYRTC